MAASEESVAKSRNDAAARLRKGEKPIVVVLDDLDRLTGSEIREVLKLVRLTASLPNIIYLLPCDRDRIEGALGKSDEGLSGRDYLEKIVQLPWNLPEIGVNVLRDQTSQAIDRALTGIENLGPFDKEAWFDIYFEIVRPLIRNIRDVRRYAMALRGTATILKGRVAAHDMLALEAIRVFLPNDFRRLVAAADALTVTSATRKAERDSQRLMTSSEDSSGLDRTLQKAFNSLVEGAGEQTAVIQAMIHRLFPAGQIFQGQNIELGNEFAAEQFCTRRVAHEHILRIYLEQQVNSDYESLENAEAALSVMSDPRAFDKHLRSLAPEQLQLVLEHLWNFEQHFRDVHVEPSIIVLMNLIPDIPDFYSHIWMGGPSLFVRRIALRLLRVESDGADRDAIIKRVWSKVPSLYGKLELVRLSESKGPGGERLVSEQAAADLKDLLLDEIMRASDDDLARETDPTSILAFAGARLAGTCGQIAGQDNPKLTFRVLWAAQMPSYSGRVDTRVVRKEIHVVTERIIELFGDEETLKDRIRSMDRNFECLTPWLERQRIPLENAEDIRELAVNYANGLSAERE